LGSFNHFHELTTLKAVLQLAPFKVVIFEVHMRAFFTNFVDFAKFIHVELPDEGGQFFVPKEIG
jgi:hypothetical protein